MPSADREGSERTPLALAVFMITFLGRTRRCFMQSLFPHAKTLYFAGGCFWGVEAYFARIPGVLEVLSGYANGLTECPTYEDVCRNNTGHAETVRVRYDPRRVRLETLVRQFFKIIDPVSRNRQGPDVGVQYRTGIYYTDPEDRARIMPIVQAVDREYDAPLAVEVGPLENFYPAEEYHQRYLAKNPGGYCHISFESLKDLPGPLAPERYARPDDNTLRRTLSPQAYAVTREAATERPFTGEYWDTRARGIYVDVTTGEPLFVSTDKFDAGCGWPSFTKPIEPEVISVHDDNSHGLRRTEVRSRVGDAHLGHVFDDGPTERGGLRYCINSAALRFVPYEAMEEEGYGELKCLLD